MIRDARVLDTSFVPNDVVHRTVQVDSLTAALDPITRGEAGETTILHGPPGTGKTCIARHVVEQLDDSTPDCTTQYVNCWLDHREFTTLQRLLEGFGEVPSVHRTSTPTDELRKSLRTRIDASYVAVLDEADQLQDEELLYKLHAMEGFTMVLIVNEPAELFDPLDGRLASRLRTATQIKFDRYSIEPLVDILEPRVRIGLANDVVSSNQLALIADLAAGDARIAIEALRLAARYAGHAGEDAISDAHIRDAIPDAQAEIRQRQAENLTSDQRILYDIVAEWREITPRELYDEYRDRVDDPMTDRTLRNYMQKMEHYNLVEAHGDGRARRYRLVE